MDDKQQARLKKVMQMFQAEASEHIQLINRCLLDIERGLEGEARDERLKEAYRSAHNIKGSARMVGLSEIEILAHSTESVLQAGMDGSLELDANVCDLLYDALDAINALIAGDEADTKSLHNKLQKLVDTSLEQDATGEDKLDTVAKSDDSSEKRQSVIQNLNNASPEETIRVDLDKLDELIAQIGELQVSRMNADSHVNQLSDTMYLVNHLARSWDELYTMVSLNNTYSHLQIMMEHQTSQVQVLLNKMQHLVQSVSSDTLRLGMVTENLRDRVRSIRMLPFETIALGFERTVRDAAHDEQKQVSFEIIGSDIEVDKSVLEIIKDPLMHLLNNAVSHGIELPEDRVTNEKPEEGCIQLRIQQRGNEVSIRVSDDGKGFDLEALKAAASGNGSHEFVNDDDLIQFAFKPGVSTATELSTISGRGIGLDVVRDKLESIHGRIQVSSNPGDGTHIELLVPTSLAITRSLLVLVDEQEFAIPISSIEKIVNVDNVVDVNGTLMLNLDGEHIPLVSLASVLEMSQNTIDDSRTNRALILGSADGRVAVLVSDVLTEQELSVKPMGSLLKSVRHVVGVAMLGNGMPIVVLSPADILRSANKKDYQGVSIRKSKKNEDEKARSIHILVVDDSITTRTLEQNILESAGYLVTTAINGVEALEQLRRANFNLVISDVQMPEMDGLELARTIRSIPEHQDLPLILVTSLMSREDKEQGMKAGADAYIVKQNFSQSEFVSIIEQYIEE